MSVTGIDTTANTRTVKLTALELEQIARWRDTARTLLDDGSLGMRDRLQRATYTSVADAWLALAELVLRLGTPPGDDVKAAERCLLLASNPDMTDQARERALRDSSSYRRAARLSADIAATKAA